MKQLHVILSAAAAAAAVAFAVPAFAQHDHSATKEEVREIKIIKTDAAGEKASRAQIAADCGQGRKFESSAESGDGAKEKRVSKMVICSDPGESDAEWAKTLRDALVRLQANDDMPDEGKARIIADLQSEIAKLGK